MTREIVVNGRFLSRPITGVERYGREILPLFRGRPRVEMTRLNGLAGHVWEQTRLPAKLKSNSVIWSPANAGPLFVRNQAVTIHDLSPLEHPEWFARGFAAWYRLFLPLLARRARVLFAPSVHVQRKLMARFGVKQVLVTPNGVDAGRFHPGATQETYAFPQKYILFVGSLQPRKNLVGLLAAWQTLKTEFKDLWLMVAGGTGDVFRGVRFLADERIRFLNYVAETDLPGLYAQAEALVLPSFDEGFGLPALEAMACGTPVIVSNGGALPETVGDAALIFDFAKPHDLTNQLQLCLSEAALRRSLREKGLARAGQFTWQASADLIWDTLHAL